MEKNVNKPLSTIPYTLIFLVGPSPQEIYHLDQFILPNLILDYFPNLPTKKYVLSLVLNAGCDSVTFLFIGISMDSGQTLNKSQCWLNMNDILHFCMFKYLNCLAASDRSESPLAPGHHPAAGWTPVSHVLGV